MMAKSLNIADDVKNILSHDDGFDAEEQIIGGVVEDLSAIPHLI
jgi:hypothetical protein